MEIKILCDIWRRYTPYIMEELQSYFIIQVLEYSCQSFILFSYKRELSLIIGRKLIKVIITRYGFEYFMGDTDYNIYIYNFGRQWSFFLDIMIWRTKKSEI